MICRLSKKKKSFYSKYWDWIDRCFLKCFNDFISMLYNLRGLFPNLSESGEAVFVINKYWLNLKVKTISYVRHWRDSGTDGFCRRRPNERIGCWEKKRGKFIRIRYCTRKRQPTSITGRICPLPLNVLRSSAWKESQKTGCNESFYRFEKFLIICFILCLVIVQNWAELNLERLIFL